MNPDSNAIMDMLQKPFPLKDVEWRIQKAGETNHKQWALILAYINARAIEERLDDVFGVLGWKTEFRESANGIFCKLSVWDNHIEDWISKEDGAPLTDYEPFKGGISSALKRVAAAGFGIGRYLYKLDGTFAIISTHGRFKGEYKDKSGKKEYFKWDIPSDALPNWALPHDKVTISQPDPEPEPKEEIPDNDPPGSLEDIAEVTNERDQVIQNITKIFSSHIAKEAKIMSNNFCKKENVFLYKSLKDDKLVELRDNLLKLLENG